MGKKRPERPVLVPPTPSVLGNIVEKYFQYYQPFADGAVADVQAPIEQLPQKPTHDLKAACYFLDASMVGVCPAEEGLWFTTRSDGTNLDPPQHDHVLVIMVETGRVPEPGNLAAEWIEGDDGRTAALRAAEIAIVAAGYVRNLGWQARAHFLRNSDIDLESAAVSAGLAANQQGNLVAPFVGSDFALAAISTDYPLVDDLPLARGALRRAKGARWWFGTGGTTSGRERHEAARRPSHLGRYPMEKIERVDATTTLILEDEVPRVPKRAAFFERALKGDLGPEGEAGAYAICHKTSVVAGHGAVDRGPRSPSGRRAGDGEAT